MPESVDKVFSIQSGQFWDSDRNLKNGELESDRCLGAEGIDHLADGADVLGGWVAESLTEGAVLVVEEIIIL